jgi:hypothetical protein
MDEVMTGDEFVHTFFVHRASIVGVLQEHREAASQAVPGPIGTEELPENERDTFAFTGLAPGTFNVVVVPAAPSVAQGDANVGQAAEPAAQENMHQIDPDGAQDGKALDTDKNEIERESDDEKDLAQSGSPANFVQVVTGQGAEGLNKISSSASAKGYLVDAHVPWSAWGPDNTRWTPEHLADSEWVTTTCGQRAVLEKYKRLIVWDFNPYSVRRERHRAKEGGKDAAKLVDETIIREEIEDSDGEQQEQARVENEVSIRIMGQPNELRSSSGISTFCEPVVSKLPYVEATTPRLSHYRYSYGVMLDEDHVLGINPKGDESAVEVYSV